MTIYEMSWRIALALAACVALVRGQVSGGTVGSDGTTTVSFGTGTGTAGGPTCTAVSSNVIYAFTDTAGVQWLFECGSGMVSTSTSSEDNDRY